VFSEAYEDSAPPYPIVETVSGPIYHNNNFVGVAAFDTKEITDTATYYNSIKFKESGFAVLVSSEGLVISNPEIWENSRRLFRLYDTQITGISFD
jgi:hypothetical protein